MTANEDALIVEYERLRRQVERLAKMIGKVARLDARLLELEAQLPDHYTYPGDPPLNGEST